MKNPLLIFLGLILFASSLNADQIDQFYEAMKFRKVKFSFKDSPSDEFWNWIDMNLNSIVKDQISWDSKKYGEKMNLMVIRGLKPKFTMTIEQSLSGTLNEALLYFRCVAIIKNDSIIVIPDSIKLDFKSYELIEGRIYKPTGK